MPKSNLPGIEDLLSGPYNVRRAARLAHEAADYAKTSLEKSSAAQALATVGQVLVFAVLAAAEDAELGQPWADLLDPDGSLRAAADERETQPSTAAPQPLDRTPLPRYVSPFNPNGDWHTCPRHRVPINQCECEAADYDLVLIDREPSAEPNMVFGINHHAHPVPGGYFEYNITHTHLVHGVETEHTHNSRGWAPIATPEATSSASDPQQGPTPAPTDIA